MTPPASQRALLSKIIGDRTIVRANELRAAGIDPQTIARAVNAGDLDRIGRGLYQRPDADIDSEQALAEAAIRVPKGIIAMLSALAYHQLTDQMPRRVWMAIGASDWMPTLTYPPMRFVRFNDRYLTQGIESHSISNVAVPVYSIPKTLADLFRNARLVDRSVAIEGLRAALDQRRATPAEIADAAKAGGAWKAMKPYLEALTSNG